MFAHHLKTTGLATSAIALTAVGGTAAANEAFVGPYMGASAGIWGGGTTGNNGSADYNIGQTVVGPGIFIGYNYLAGPNNDWVVGGEAAFDNSSYESTDYELSRGFSAKIKVGRAVGSGDGSFGNMLVYGFASYGTYLHSEDGDQYGSVRGPGVGVGVEVDMQGGLSLGAELHQQIMTHTKTGYNYGTAMPSTLSFRAIVRF